MICKDCLKAGKKNTFTSECQITIDPRRPLKWLFFQAVSRTVGFIHVIKKSDHMMINVSWRGWPKFAAQSLQIPQKF